MKILLAEDNPQSADALAVLLRRQGYEVDVVGDGTEMLQHLDKVDIVLTDIKMPHMDGISAAYVIKHHIDKRMPIIALTGYIEKYLDTPGLPFDKVLKKPLDLSTVITAIELAVGLRLAPVGPTQGRRKTDI